jgi:hypothetical protein
MAQLSTKALSALNDETFGDDSAAESGADDGGNGSGEAIGSEENEMPPEGAGIAIIDVSDRFAETPGEMVADVEAGPIGVHKVGGTAGAEHTGSTRRAGRIKTYDRDVVELGSGHIDSDVETVGDLLEADFGALTRPGRIFTQSFDEELLLRVQQGKVDGGSAKIDSGCNLQGCYLLTSVFELLTMTE